MPDFLPYGRQWVEDDDIEAVVNVLRSDFLTTGPAVDAFEGALGRATGAKHAVAVNSGTSALHAMYFGTGLGPGDEIITSPLTFAATANAALYLGATVRFADVEPDTGNLDPDAVRAAIGDRTRLIVPVDFAGHPADYDRLRALADEFGLGLVADAAHSLGASHKGRAVGTIADASAVSFHPVKPVTTGEGGAVLTDLDGVASRAATFRTHGITKDPHAMDEPDPPPWWYEQHELGFNYRLTDLQAALGSSQLAKLDRFIARRREIATMYDAALADVEEIERPGRRKEVEPGWHLYVIRTRDPGMRRPLFDRLRSSGLGVQVHYIPVHWHPFHAASGHPRGCCPNAEHFYACAISLPLFPAMTDQDVDRVVSILVDAVAAVA
jgi:UDP-4-amino-4,6-dideoxy-N-acetyl-beta-L-altrosamine transaminase